MAVNTSVYGTSEQWINSAFTPYATNKNKVAYFAANQSRLENGVSNGKLSYSEPIDKSLSYCGLGTESALSHVGWIWLDEDNNTYDIMEWQDRQVTNFAFFQQDDSNIDMSLSPNQLDYTTPLSRGLFWQELQSDWNHNKYLQPYTSINPHNFVLCIYIYATNSTYSSTVDVDYKTYFTSYKSSHPNIIHAYYVPYFNNQQWTSTNPVRTVSGNTETSINTNLRTLCYGQLDDYNPVGKVWDFYSYYFVNNVFFGYYSRSPFTIYGKKMAFVFATENSKSHVQILTTGGDNDYKLPTIQYYDGIELEILRSIACFGLYFTTDNNVAKTGFLTNSDMYIGILDRQGVGHGLYYKGADTARAPQADPAFTDMHTIDYDPEGVHIDYDTSSHYGTLSYYNFNKMYSVTNEQVELLYRELTAAMSAKPNDMTETDYSKGTFLTNDPIDCIISLRKYPIISTTSSSTVHDIYFGGYQSALSAPYANNAETIRYEFTGTKAFISKYGGGFLDKEGYTTAELFVPFCGTVKLPVNEFIDRTLSVKLIVDYLTGTCTAYIELDGIPRMTINGSIGVDVPVTGIQTNELQNTINRNIANLKTAQITAGMTARSGASIATGSGSASSAIMSAVNMINPIAIANKMDSTEKALISRDLAEYNLYHTEIPFKTVSAGDALTAGFGEWRCRLSITRPVLSQSYLDDPTVYAKTIGYACLKTGKVSEFSGLTVGTIDLSGINCTDKEKEMIIQAFKSGVYL